MITTDSEFQLLEVMTDEKANMGLQFSSSSLPHLSFSELKCLQVLTTS